jgi:hypothetical protein
MPKSDMQQANGSTATRTPPRKPPLADRLALWMSHSSKVDGLWIGTMESEAQVGLRRVEEALLLIKRQDGLNYSRIIRNLDRIWVNLAPGSLAHYDRSLNACVFDERFVRNEATTVEDIASTIVHEATHARLESWGVTYDEAKRPRIEAICLRRELDFARKLSDGDRLRQEIVNRLEWLAGDRDFYSNTNFQQRRQEAEIETLRYLNAPSWLVRWASWLIHRRRQRASASLGRRVPGRD